jgi:hypothetical protein
MSSGGRAGEAGVSVGRTERSGGAGAGRVLTYRANWAYIVRYRVSRAKDAGARHVTVHMTWRGVTAG